MMILDTNVLSALMQATPDKQVVAWLDKQPRTSIWTTSVTIPLALVGQALKCVLVCEQHIERCAICSVTLCPLKHGITRPGTWR